MNNRLLVISIFIASALCSLVSYLVPIDPDFFSFYYIGQGVAKGMHMYRDFPESKGPFHFLFFAVLAGIFKNRYDLALVTGGTIVDTVSLYYLFKILRKRYLLEFSTSRVVNMMMIVFVVVVYKSFAVGGLYAETLAMMFFLVSFWHGSHKRLILSGIFFGLSVMTRITFVYFIIFFLIDTYLNRKRVIDPIWFLVGMGGLCLAVLIPFVVDGSLPDLINIMILTSLQYSKTTGSFMAKSIIYESIMHIRIPISILIVIITLIFTIRSDQPIRRYWRDIILVSFCSWMATFPGAVFYGHHFVQFLLALFMCLSLTYAQKNRRTYTLAAAALLFFWSFVHYTSSIKGGHNIARRLLHTHPVIREISGKKYLQVVSYYPQYYAIYQKRSPDKYYQPFLLSKDYIGDNSRYVAEHQKIAEGKMNDTVFLFVRIQDSEAWFNTEYRAMYSELFQLKRVNSYKDGDIELDIYLTQ